MKLKEYLEKAVCKKCGNKDKSKMELYFVSERKSIEHPVITTKYLSCLKCNTPYKIDDRDKTKDYLLEPMTAMAG